MPKRATAIVLNEKEQEGLEQIIRDPFFLSRTDRPKQHH